MIISDYDARMGLCALGLSGDPETQEMVREQGALNMWLALLNGEGSRSLAARRVDLAQLREATRRAGARFIVPIDDEWPDVLAQLDGHTIAGASGQPLGLWVKGSHLRLLPAPAVAVVGACASTQYGERVTNQMVTELSNHGATVVSGLAYGIDGAAQRAALHAGGLTLAVLPSGIDKPHPHSHARLADEIIAAGGALITEQAPGSRPTRRSFLARDRLIAALSQGLVVVEAAVRSGAASAAAWAHTLGTPTMAVPGPIDSSMSCTPNALIRDGRATLVTSGRDILATITEQEAPAA